MISNCGADENKQYHGGKAGDQTGGEWNIREWYNRPWIGVFRHPNETIRKDLADMAKSAANNNNVGYDQWQRTTFWTELVKAEYKPENIKTPCEADCSSGVAAIAKAAGHRNNDAKLQAIPETMYTGNQKSLLKKAGFEYLDDPKYLTSDKYLIPGDILYYNKKTKSGYTGHTAINLDYGSEVKPTAPVSVPTPVPAPVEKKDPDNTAGFKPYLVKVTIKDLNIRTGPGTNYQRVKFIEPNIYTIVEQKGTWGKLKSGIGWISLNFTERV